MTAIVVCLSALWRTETRPKWTQKTAVCSLPKPLKVNQNITCRRQVLSSTVYSSYVGHKTVLIAITFTSCRLGLYAVLRLYLTHTYLSRRLLPPPSIYKFAVTTFSDQHLRHDFIIQLVIRYVDVQISRSTPGSRSLHITVLRHTLWEALPCTKCYDRLMYIGGIIRLIFLLLDPIKPL